MAAETAKFAMRAVKGISKNVSWDPRFSPFDGDLETDHKWFIEVGDLRFIRVVTDANPSYMGLFEFPWMFIDRNIEAKDAVPTVLIRVDIVRLPGSYTPEIFPQGDRAGWSFF